MTWGSFGWAMEQRARGAQENRDREMYEAQTRRIIANKPVSSGGGGGGGMATPPPPAATPTFSNIGTISGSSLGTALQTEQQIGSVDDYLKSAKPFLYGGMVRDPNGSPKKDTVHAKLADKEAVLNAPAAAFLGEDLIAKLNQMGKKAMGMPADAEAEMVDGEVHAAAGLTPGKALASAGDVALYPATVAKQLGAGMVGYDKPVSATPFYDAAYRQGMPAVAPGPAQKVGAALADVLTLPFRGVQAVGNALDPVEVPAVGSLTPYYDRIRGMTPQTAAPQAPNATPAPKAAAPVQAPKAAAPQAPQAPKAVAPVAPFAALPANATQDQRSNYSLAEQGLGNIVRKGNTYTNMGAVNPYAAQRFKEQDGLTGTEIAARNKTYQDAAYKAAMDRQAAAKDEWLRTYHPAQFAQLQQQKFTETEAPINRAHELKKQGMEDARLEKIAQITAGGKAAPKFVTRTVVDPTTKAVVEQLYEERTGLSQAQYAANQAIQAQLQSKPSGQYTIVVAGKPMRVQYNAETDSVTPVN